MSEYALLQRAGELLQATVLFLGARIAADMRGATVRNPKRYIVRLDKNQCVGGFEKCQVDDHFRLESEWRGSILEDIERAVQ